MNTTNFFRFHSADTAKPAKLNRTKTIAAILLLSIVCYGAFKVGQSTPYVDDDYLRHKAALSTCIYRLEDSCAVACQTAHPGLFNSCFRITDNINSVTRVCKSDKPNDKATCKKVCQFNLNKRLFICNKKLHNQ